MDNHLNPHQQDAFIEDALRSQPLAPMPRDITANVMAQIQAVPVPRPFQVTWNDFAIALVISVCIGAVWFSVLNLPPFALAQIRMQSILLYQDFIVNARWIVPAVLFGLAAILSAMTIPYLRRQLAN